MERQPPRLMRPHAVYTIVIITPLARQLYNLTVGMANALSKLGLAVQHSLPPEQGRQAAALAFEILAALQRALDQERAALEERNVVRVTAFPVALKRELKICHANALRAMDLLVALDKTARTWYDLWFQGLVTPEEFEAKTAEWRRRFRRASQQINNLLQSQHGGHSGQESQKFRTGQASLHYLHGNR